MTDGLTHRLLARIARDFNGQEARVVELLNFAESGTQDRERVLAAILFSAAGKMLELELAVKLSRLDWREVLVSGNLADGGWRQEIDRRLGIDSS